MYMNVGVSDVTYFFEFSAYFTNSTALIEKTDSGEMLNYSLYRL